MSSAGNDRIGRLAAVGLFLLLVAALLLLTFGVGYTLFEQERDQAASVLRVTGQVRAVIERQQAVADGLAGIDKQQLLETVYLTAPNAAVAVATLQDRITTLAALSGAQMRRISVVDGSGATTARVSVQAQVSGNLDQLSSFLVGVESNRPLLTIEQISIMRMRTRRTRKSKGPAKYQDPEGGRTWTGRGRVPLWVSGHEESGGSRDDLLIKSPAKPRKARKKK